MLFHAIARHFSYFPPKFQMLSFEAEIWAAMPLSSDEEPDGVTEKYGPLIRAPRYLAYLGMPNLAFITKRSQENLFPEEESSLHFGCGQFISDGKKQLDVVEYNGEQHVKEAPTHLRSMRSYSPIFEFINLDVIVRNEWHKYRRCRKHPLDVQKTFVYGRKSFLHGNPVFEYVAVSPTTNLPDFYSVWSRPGHQEILRTVFSKWIVCEAINPELFELPSADESLRWWKSTFPDADIDA